MTDDKSPIEQAVDQALDAFLYAPIGLIFDGPALFPKLVEKGRNQVQVARMMGQMAVQMGQSEAEKRLATTEGPVRELFTAMGVVSPPPTPAPEPKPTVASTRSTKASAKRAPAVQPKPAAKKPVKKAAKAAAKKPAKKAAKAATPLVSSLDIPDYDSLSASQVVKRLRGLSASDLDAIREYEAATRSRKTILNRIAQLQKA